MSDDETVDDALKTVTSSCHIYLVFRLHLHRPPRDFGARRYPRAKERSW